MPLVLRDVAKIEGEAFGALAAATDARSRTAEHRAAQLTVDSQEQGSWEGQRLLVGNMLSQCVDGKTKICGMRNMRMKAKQENQCAHSTVQKFFFRLHRKHT